MDDLKKWLSRQIDDNESNARHCRDLALPLTANSYAIYAAAYRRVLDRIEGGDDR